ncbi:LicD family protein [Candidatus Saccharibacteria bacterium]|nr:LicD family protein [Candidatus Saccharibacteria bacterium]
MPKDTKPKVKDTKSKKPKVVLLVPFSSEDPSRLRIWNHVHSWLKKTLIFSMYIGEHFPDKPIFYNLSLARNQAALKAKDWDVAIIHDADTVINPRQIQLGVAAALDTGAVTYPYTERYELDFEGTNMLLADETSNWQSHLRKYTRNQPLGGCIIVRRDLWELVRGFDSGFVGWGHEDGAFAIACEILSGKKLQRVPGKSLHLEHTLAPAKNPDSPVYKANRKRIDKYLEATRRPDAQQVIKKLRDESIKTDSQAGIKWAKKHSTNVMDPDTATMLLEDVASLMEKYKCTYWLSDGTLLGAIRENNFIAHDYDIDLGVWAEDFDIRVIHDLLKKFSCQLLRLQGKPDDGLVITVGRAGIHLDMFFYYPRKQTSKTKNKDKVIYSCLYSLYQPYNTSNRAKRYDCDFPNYKPLVRRKFLGKEYWVPKNAQRHLEVTYGPDWQTPKSSWDLFNDQRNLTLYGTIEDMFSERLIAEKYLKIKAK